MVNGGVKVVERDDLVPAGRSCSFENVGVRYGMGPEVLRDLTFSIEPNSFQFLTGPSGRRQDDALAADPACRCGRPAA